MANKHPTKFPGVRFREHASRKHGPRPDRYFSIRYRFNDKVAEEGVGWASDGWSPEQASNLLGLIRKGIKTGQGPLSLADMRAREEALRRAEADRVAELALESLTLADLAERYLAWARVNKRSWRTDAIWINVHLLPVLGGRSLAAITPAHVERLKESEIAAGKAPATVRHVLGMLRALYNFAGRTAVSLDDPRPLWRGLNPVVGVAMPKKDNARVRFLTYEEATDLLEQARDYPKKRRRGVDFHDICLLALNTGLRKSEVLALTWADVDLEHRVIHVLDAKAGDGQVPVNRDVLEMLCRRRVKPWRRSDLVFPGALGGQKSMVSHTFSLLVDEMELNHGVEDPRKKVCFHTLRHTFASWLALQGTDLYRIKELMRHKTITQTQRYAHLLPDATRQAVDELADRRRAKLKALRQVS